MPDQSSASTEHALIQEITAPLATLPDNPVPVVADTDFPVVLRGYDRVAVDAYVKKTSQLVAELTATRSPETAVRRALERVGEEVSGILQRAHETAAQITTQSRSEAEDRLEAARQEGAQITARAADRLKELDIETDRIWEERRRIIEDARQLARQLTALADSAAERFPPAEDATAGTADVGQPADGAVEEPEVPQPDDGAASAVEEWGRAASEAEAAPGAAEDPDREATAIMPPVHPPEEDEPQH